jgi:protease I
MKALFIIAQQGYQDWEYETPKQILENEAVRVITASTSIGIAQGSLGGKASVSLTLDKVDVSDYDAIVFIGGPGAVKYQQDPGALSIAKQANQQKKIIGAICIAPTILACAGILKGKRATVWNKDGKQQSLLESKGAVYTGESVTIDNNIITANGPQAAKEFGEAVLNILQKKH